VHALTFRYGQRHAHEIEAARAIARRCGIRRHEIIDVDLGSIGGSALTAPIDIPKDRDPEATTLEIPVTYVPARNTIFLAFALAWSEVLEAQDIFIGVNAVDYSGYPDCRPEYIAAYETMANLATRAGVEGTRPVRIRAPLIGMRKSGIIKLGVSLGVDYAMTTSCYDPDVAGLACGRCDACLLRLAGFRQAGLGDPARYASRAGAGG
jgi:7-cyano-7-deazaguanine synthase